MKTQQKYNLPIKYLSLLLTISTACQGVLPLATNAQTNSHPNQPSKSEQPLKLPSTPTLTPQPNETDTRDSAGIHYEDIIIGHGASPQKGHQITINYIGWLADCSKIDSNSTGNKTITFSFDTGAVIKGLEYGLATMQVGGKRKISIPPCLAYETLGSYKAIPPFTAEYSQQKYAKKIDKNTKLLIHSNTTIIYEVELLKVN